MIRKSGIFVASTGQNVGKTTTCLGLFSGLQKRYGQIQYMKPIGQEHITIGENIKIDKDVLIFKNRFSLDSAYKDMSPILIPQGFTRDFLDQKIDSKQLEAQIINALHQLQTGNRFVLIEGTGHCGVGSILNMNNAQVASLLNVPMILIASGGLGSAYDQLMLNKTLCEKYNVPVLGVILNQVLPEKQEMIQHYMSLALKQWNLPLIGMIPFDPLLSHPSMRDFENLFDTRLLTGEKNRLRHCKHNRLVATSVETFHAWIIKNQLIITPANREDIILATLSAYWDIKIANPHDDLETAMILTGDYPPRHYITEELQKAHIPMLYTPFHSHTVMKMISSFTAKIQIEDVEKVEEAINLVERHINFDLL